MTKAAAVGRLIEAFRRRRGITKTALAAAAGVPLSFLIKAVRGDATLTMERIELVAEALGLDAAEVDRLELANLRARANREGRELARRERLGAVFRSPVEGPAPAAPSRLPASEPVGAAPAAAAAIRVPVLARVPPGDPAGYATHSCALEGQYLSVPAPMLRDHDAVFGLRIDGDSMAPRIKHADVVLVSPHSPLRHGKAAVASVDAEVTCRLWHAAGDEVILRPLNAEYADLRCPRSKVEWACPVVLVISAV